MTVPIAHVIHSLGLGGAQQVVKYLVSHGDKATFAHRVYAGSTGVFHSEVEAAGAAVSIVQRYVPKFDPIWIAKLATLLHRDEIRLVHTHLFGDSLHGTIAAQWAGRIPVIVTIHNSLADFTGVQRAGYKWMLPRAARVVACSESAGASFRTLVDEKLISAIPNGIDPSAVPPVTESAVRIARETLGVPASAVLVGAVGRLVPQKGFSFLLSAFRSVIDRTRADVRLVLLGTGPDEAALRRQAGEAGIADRVSFLGFRSDARELMVGFDVLVFSSLYEGLPMTLLEGMAARRCIVSTDAPGLGEVLTDGSDAVLARPRDPESLALALSRAIEQPELRQRLGEAAYRTFLSRYTVERMVTAYERLYREVLAEHRSG
jgi:glycosyltransferase involved in cell wall biosynthesis